MTAVMRRLFQSMIAFLLEDGRPRLSRNLSQFVQLTLRFLPQDGQLLRPPSNPLHNLGWSFSQKLLVAQLTLTVGKLFLDLLQFFFQTLPLHGDVNLSLVNDMHIETRSVTRSRQLGQRMLFKLELLDI